MKKHKTVSKKVKEVSDILCDSCGKSTKQFHGKTPMGFSCMHLEANWGYYSNKDCEKWEAHICEECVDKKLKFIKFNREMYNPMNGAKDVGGTKALLKYLKEKKKNKK